MLDDQVGWDPISVNHQLPWEERVFIVYLALVLVFSLARSPRLEWKLWSFSPARRVSSDQPKPDASDLLAASALANKLPNNDKTTETSWQVVEGARPRFEYLWEQSAARIAAIRNLVNLTLILSGLVLSYDLMRIFIAVQIEMVWGGAVIAEMVAEVLQAVNLGLALAAALYVLSNLYAAALARRKATWNLFVATASSQRKGD